jgi:hypothetical protein
MRCHNVVRLERVVAERAGDSQHAVHTVALRRRRELQREGGRGRLYLSDEAARLSDALALFVEIRLVVERQTESCLVPAARSTWSGPGKPAKVHRT